MLVSIVVPSYNCGEYIAEAIQSALDQTYRDKEVIVIDDGSTDASLDIIKSFGSRIRWETGPNRGGCAARNRGVALAHGELIQFLDADDVLHPQKLERQIPVVLSNPEHLVYSDYEVRSLNGSLLASRCAPVAIAAADAVAFILRKYGLQTIAPIHWKKTLEAVGGFRESLSCSQERDLHIRLACSGISFRYLPEVLFTVRRVPGSVSANMVNVLLQHREIAWTAHRILSDAGELTDCRMEALAGFLAMDAREFLRIGMVKEAAMYFRDARRFHPTGGTRIAYGKWSRLLCSVVGASVTESIAEFRQRVGNIVRRNSVLESTPDSSVVC